jgi:MFS transporter, putative metabolite:H+ symporter
VYLSRNHPTYEGEEQMVQFEKRISMNVVLILIVSVLGYFVDVYDLIIFSVVRNSSLTSLGVSQSDLLPSGLFLLNLQLTGVLIGGFLWGILGDKLGRLSVLFGSIIIYSCANVLNAYVDSLWQYEILRFVAGFGLAGELGAGITIVSEVLPAKYRGYGTMLIAAVGLLGAIVASEFGLHFSWQTTYLIGGLMGFALLIMRAGVAESPLFKEILQTHAKRGSLTMLFGNPKKLWRYFLCILSGAPLYFVIGILITASPEIGRSLGLITAPIAAISVLVSYLAMSIGDIACSSLSQILRSRRKAIITFHLLTAASIGAYLFLKPSDLQAFYWRCAFLGFSIGFWALVVTNAAEQFGTNLRSTVATTVPNLIRGMLIPITWAFKPLKENVGIVDASALIGFFCVAVAIAACYAMDESFGKNLDYIEG